MNKKLLPLVLVLLYALAQAADTPEPLLLVRTMEMPGVPIGPYMDHFGVDLKGHRLFATPQAHKSVQVFDLEQGKFIHEVTGFGNAHAVIYREDLNQFYVSDGGDAGEVKIFSGEDYHLIKSVRGLTGADSTGYDPRSKELFIVTGGPSAKLDYSAITIVDTTKGERVGEIDVPGSGHLEQIAVEESGPRIYVNIEDKNEVAFMDKQTRTLVARIPLTKGKNNFPIALDEKHHRLFVGCRTHDASGVIVVIDTETQKEIAALPIGGNVDYMDFDPRNGRIYATCGTGNIYVYNELSPNQYALLGTPETAVMAKTGLLVPELNRFFVAVPNLSGGQDPKILEFQIQ
jgi:DNA-binding beta-propeller fold protein YncE